jgi:hypothetical protein
MAKKTNMVYAVHVFLFQYASKAHNKNIIWKYSIENLI